MLIRSSLLTLRLRINVIFVYWKRHLVSMLYPLCVYALHPVGCERLFLDEGAFGYLEQRDLSAYRRKCLVPNRDSNMWLISA